MPPVPLAAAGESPAILATPRLPIPLAGAAAAVAAAAAAEPGPSQQHPVDS